MYFVGAVEIAAGLMVIAAPWIGGYVVALWLAGIVVNLLTHDPPLGRSTAFQRTSLLFRDPVERERESGTAPSQLPVLVGARPLPRCFRGASVIVVVCALVRDRVGLPRDLVNGDDAALDEQPLERVVPALVVAPGVPDGPGPEFLPLDDAALAQRHREPERAALPRRVEDKLAVPAGQRRLVHGHDSGRPVPTMLSRVTSAASSSSLMSSVPGGRIGTTR